MAEKKKILIVDDEEDSATALKLFIEKTGKYEARVETLGTRAFTAAKQFKPDLLLLDIMMPNVDGGEVATQMKADKETRDIPIVFVSGVITKDEAKEQGSIQGGYPVLAKPVSMKELMEVIGKYAAEKSISKEGYSAPSLRAKKDIRATDRRKHARVRTGGLLPYICMDRDDNLLREGMGDAINISKIGLQLKTHLPIETEYILLAIKSVENKLINIKGKVIYSQMLGPDIFQTGVNFIEPDVKAQQFVVELVKSYNLQKSGDKNP